MLIKSNKIFNKVLTYFLLILFSSCSLKYTEIIDVSKTVPELILQNTVMTCYEDNQITLNMNAEVLEQYQDSSETYAKNISFTSYDNGNVSTKGSCGLIFTDTDKEIYELYNEIELFNSKENLYFYANVLKWNAKTEQLIGGRGDIVKIEKDDTVIRGSGFSASGISNTFSFRGNVTGEIESE